MYPEPNAFPSAGLLNDMHRFNPIEMGWTNLSTPSAGQTPPPRFGHGFSYAGGRLYVHAGAGATGILGLPRTFLVVMVALSDSLWVSFL